MHPIRPFGPGSSSCASALARGGRKEVGAAPVRFSPAFRGALYTVAEALFSSSEGPPRREHLDAVVSGATDYLFHAGLRTRIIFRVTLFLLTWIVPLFWLRPPLLLQGLNRRAQTLDRIEQSVLGLPLFLVKALLCMLYYEIPEVASRMGYDGEPLVVIGEGRVS